MSRLLYDCYALGDSAIVIQLGTTIDPKVHEQVRQLADYLEENRFQGFGEIVTAYTSITIYYDGYSVFKDRLNDFFLDELLPYEIVFAHVQTAIAQYENLRADLADEPSQSVEIPVCYGGMHGPDLQAVADYHGMTPEDVVGLHSSQDYPVYLIGFAPGFPYLGGMDERIATPRKSVPRQRIPIGSVGIGGSQTGIYSLETPGGWNLIGRTPIALFRPQSANPSLLKVGDRVRFVPIKEEQYEQFAERERRI
ncbi:5-oxoprolinase subunit PxpB [Paenibacillus sp. SI8]|uniref:5-oxoprolinase subunit PxpB n=1 Tax=unclassified Paenibacillus TaxID=185978 RepID=UPI0034676DAB